MKSISCANVSSPRKAPKVVAAVKVALPVVGTERVYSSLMSTNLVHISITTSEVAETS